MKKILIIYLLFVFGSLISCRDKNPFVERVYRITMINNTPKIVNEFYQNKYPDTTLPISVPYLGGIRPFNSTFIDSKQKWEDKFNEASPWFESSRTKAPIIHLLWYCTLLLVLNFIKMKPLFLSTILFFSCMNHVSNKRFSIKKQGLSNNIFKTNGFYYIEGKTTQIKYSFPVDNSKIDTTIKGFLIYLFYLDGSFGHITWKGRDISEILKDKNTVRLRFKKFMDDNKQWGRYQIVDNRLTVQYFQHANLLNTYLFEEKGELLSDTTFVLKTQTYYYSNAGDTSLDNFKMPYYFNFFSCNGCKPDSVNWTMKKFNN